MVGPQNPLKMPLTEKKRGFKTHEFLLFDVLYFSVQGMLYLAASAAPVAVLWNLRELHPAVLMGLAVASIPFAGFVFTMGLILLRWIFVGTLPASTRFNLTDPKRVRIAWTFNMLLMQLMWASPFWKMVVNTFFLRSLFYWGMGAEICNGVILAGRVTDPFNLTLGHRVAIGDEAIIVGHKIENGVVTLDAVEIGDDVTVGGRAVIMPGVKIGAGAAVASGAIVQAGTVIQAGEIWGGNPAVRIHGGAEIAPTEFVGAISTSTPSVKSYTKQIASNGVHTCSEAELEIVRQACATVLRQPLSRVDADMRLFEDLMINSLDLLDVAVQIEAQNGTFIDEADIHRVRTVRDLAILSASKKRMANAH